MNFLKASETKFKAIGVTVDTTSALQMDDGEYVIHMELTDPYWRAAWGQPGFTPLGIEDLPVNSDIPGGPGVEEEVVIVHPENLQEYVEPIEFVPAEATPPEPGTMGPVE